MQKLQLIAAAAVIVVVACALGVDAQSSTTTTTAPSTTTTTTAASTTTTTTSTTTTTAQPTTTPAPTPPPANKTVVVADNAQAWRYAGPPDLRPLRNVTCPFSRWQGEPRTCLECRWCPYKKSACCEMEDEIAALKSINVSGATDWDCFITIMHFQQCGRCSPQSSKMLMNKTLNWVWDPRGVVIRPCRVSCRYIYSQCQGVKTLVGEPIVPPGMDETTFCAEFPELNKPEAPCFDSAGIVEFSLALVTTLLVVLIA